MSDYHLHVDRIRCDGRGICASALPERITLDDWGYPAISPQPIDDALLGAARQAVNLCPVLALRLAAVHRASAPNGGKS